MEECSPGEIPVHEAMESGIPPEETTRLGHELAFASSDSPRGSVHHELSVLALIRGRERYVYVFDDQSREELLDAIRVQAANPALSLTWYDAAVLAERVRQLPTDPGKPTPQSGS